MAMNRATRRLALWLVLAATLFSALSPAMASMLFADRPEILARVLGARAAPSASLDAGICHVDPSLVASPAPDAGPPAEDSGHGAHGLYCAFCLASAACLALPGAACGSLVLSASVATLLPAAPVQPPPANIPLTRHPRDPPSALR